MLPATDVHRLVQEVVMFSSLDEQIRQDEARSSSPRERWMKYCGITLTSVFVFAGLFAAIMLFAE
jgi:hypothetical protein